MTKTRIAHATGGSFAWALHLGGDAGAKLLTKFALVEQVGPTLYTVSSLIAPGFYGFRKASGGQRGVPSTPPSVLRVASATSPPNSVPIEPCSYT